MGLFEQALRVGLSVAGYRSRRLETPLGRIHALEAEGSGSLPRFVLLHGLSSEGSHYAPVLPALRRASRGVLAPDAPGHGQSFRAPLPFDRRGLEAAYFSALDQAIGERCVLVGNSMGGLAAVRYAIHAPERIAGLVLISPAGAPLPPSEFERWLRIVRVETLREALAFVDRVFARRLLIRHFVAMGLLSRFLSAEVRAVLDHVRPEDLLTSAELERLEVPVLLIWGRKDRLLDPRGLEFFRAHLPHATIEEPEDFGHSPYLETPRAVAERLIAFAEAVAAEPTRGHRRHTGRPPAERSPPSYHPT